MLNVGDRVSFACNGRGRGGHYTVYGVITKVNRKTYAITERQGSYRPGTLWAWPKELVRLEADHNKEMAAFAQAFMAKLNVNPTPLKVRDPFGLMNEVEE